MNAAVRAITRMGIYVGAKVYLIYEVNMVLCYFISLPVVQIYSLLPLLLPHAHRSEM